MIMSRLTMGTEMKHGKGEGGKWRTAQYVQQIAGGKLIG